MARLEEQRHALWLKPQARQPVSQPGSQQQGAQQQQPHQQGQQVEPTQPTQFTSVGSVTPEGEQPMRPRAASPWPPVDDPAEVSTLEISSPPQDFGANTALYPPPLTSSPPLSPTRSCCRSSGTPSSSHRVAFKPSSGAYEPVAPSRARLEDRGPGHREGNRGSVLSKHHAQDAALAQVAAANDLQARAEREMIRTAVRRDTGSDLLGEPLVPSSGLLVVEYGGGTTEAERVVLEDEDMSWQTKVSVQHSSSSSIVSSSGSSRSHL